jgi:hypothetical protein
MTHPLEKIEEEIRSLSAAEKTELVRSLIAELDAPADTDVERAWLEGKSKVFPANVCLRSSARVFVDDI